MKKTIKVEVTFSPGWEERYIKAVIKTAQKRSKHENTIYRTGGAGGGPSALAV